MPTHWIRSLLVSTLVLGSLGTITDAALAEEPRPRMIPFKCTTPRLGAERCGDENQNVRVGSGKRLSISWEDSDDKEACAIFHVVHAVSGKELARSKELCKAPKADRTWANPKDESVDVYVTVESTNRLSHVNIGGWYIIDVP